jgi:hypothetical protein
MNGYVADMTILDYSIYTEADICELLDTRMVYVADMTMLDCSNILCS